MAYPNYINCRSPEPIKTDLLESDIKMLLDNDIITSKQLRQWAEQITKVSAELDKLYSLVEFALPHKTDGQCYRLDIGRNRLLDVIFAISDSHSNFTDKINITKDRVIKILNENTPQQPNNTAQKSLF